MAAAALLHLQPVSLLHPFAICCVCVCVLLRVSLLRSVEKDAPRKTGSIVRGWFGEGMAHASLAFSGMFCGRYGMGAGIPPGKGGKAVYTPFSAVCITSILQTASLESRYPPQRQASPEWFMPQKVLGTRSLGWPAVSIEDPQAGLEPRLAGTLLRLPGPARGLRHGQAGNQAMPWFPPLPPAPPPAPLVHWAPGRSIASSPGGRCGAAAWPWRSCRWRCGTTGRWCCRRCSRPGRR